jgi:hypothetical protein
MLQVFRTVSRTVDISKQVFQIWYTYVCFFFFFFVFVFVVVVVGVSSDDHLSNIPEKLVGPLATPTLLFFAPTARERVASPNNAPNPIEPSNMMESVIMPIVSPGMPTAPSSGAPMPSNTRNNDASDGGNASPFFLGDAQIAGFGRCACGLDG